MAIDKAPYKGRGILTNTYKSNANIRRNVHFPRENAFIGVQRLSMCVVCCYY